jgi:hypothetical protein
MAVNRSTLLRRGDWFLIFLALLGLLCAVLYMIGTKLKHSGQGTVFGDLVTPGIVKRRKDRDLEWENIGGRQVVYLKDRIYTPEGMIATITTPDGQTIEIEPNTMIVLDEHTREHMAITVLAGDFKTKSGAVLSDRKRLSDFPPSERDRYLLPIVLPPDLFPPAPGRLAEITSLETQWSNEDKNWKRLRRGDDSLLKVHPSPGRLSPIEVTDFELQLLKPAPEANVIADKSPWLNFRWTSIPLEGVQYTLQIKGTGAPILSHITSKRSLYVQLDAKGTFHWQVTAKRGAEKILSPLRTFTLSAPSARDLRGE